MTSLKTSPKAVSFQHEHIAGQGVIFCVENYFGIFLCTDELIAFPHIKFSIASTFSSVATNVRKIFSNDSKKKSPLATKSD